MPGENDIEIFDEPRWIETILRESLARHSHALVELSSELEKASDYPTETPKKLACLIRFIADTLAKSLHLAPADNLAHVDRLLQELGLHLRLIERSRISHTPWSMIESTEAFLQSHLDDKTHFLIRPRWSYNYSIQGEFFGSLTRKLKAFDWIPAQELDRMLAEYHFEPIYCVSFPRIERMNPLLHANWGHELGHIIADQWDVSHFQCIWQAVEAEFSTTIRRELEKNPPNIPHDLFRDLVIEQSVLSRTKEACNVLRNGLAELISDAIGFHLFGPASLLAASEFAARWGLDTGPLSADNYPPWRYRLRLLCGQADGEFAGLVAHASATTASKILPLVTRLNQIQKLCDEQRDWDVLKSDTRTRLPYEFIAKNFPSIRATCLQLLPAHAKSPYLLSAKSSTIESLVSRLELDLPPNETGVWPNMTPAHLPDILNAAWVRHIASTSSTESRDVTAEFHKLSGLTLKAIESSFFFIAATKALHPQDGAN